MLHLLDANVLIDADRDYYPIGRVPEFWDWLIHNGSAGRAKIPIEIYEEITAGAGELANWAKSTEVKSNLLLSEEADVRLVSQVVERGYASDLTDAEITTIGRDPFLISYALADSDGRCVVTKEVSRPGKKRANRKVPNVCDDLGLRWEDAFGFMRALDFRTAWKSG